MPAPKRVGDLEVNQDLAYQRREWLIERIGWIVMTLIIVAGLLGLFGQGWLSSAEATDPSGALRLRYERFPHYQDPTQLILTIPASAVREGRCRVWIDRDYLAQVHLKAMTPEPVRHELGADRQWFVFNIADPDERVEIVMWLAPAVRGSLSGRLGVAMQTGEGKAGDSDGAKGADDADAEREPALSFGHFVYP